VRVLIAAENASARYGGEAFLPLQYFRLLRERGVEAWLLAHARTRDELHALLPGERDRMHFAADTAVQKGLCRVARHLPHRVEMATTGALSHAVTQLQQRRLARRLIVEHGIDLVHEANPVSPRQPSALFDLGVPVVIGPMNGGMSFPPGFRERERPLARLVLELGRMGANVMNVVVPGKRRAALLLVANPRTREALPPVVRSVRTSELVENGVDLSVFEGADPLEPTEREGPARFVFVGRLVEWKGVDLLLEAFARIARTDAVHLDLCGDGAERPALEALAGQLGVTRAVTFHGFLPQPAVAARLRAGHALVLPSLYESGGAVILEAMACGRPVVATRWGGPTDYLDETCGVLVEPASRPGFVDGLEAAMRRLARDPALRRTLGEAGRRRVVERFDWRAKIDHMIALYHEVAGLAPPVPVPRAPAAA
jgi:glycosyltransferase involved in cell wall biosynthesis